MVNCVEAADKPPVVWGLGLLLTIGIVVTYIPQFISLIKLRDSTGLSYFSLLLWNLSCFFLVLGALITEWDTVMCCSEVSFLQCNSILLQFYQLGIGWVNVFPLYILAVVFYPTVAVTAPAAATHFFARDEDIEEEESLLQRNEADSATGYSVSFELDSIYADGPLSRLKLQWRGVQRSLHTHNHRITLVSLALYLAAMPALAAVGFTLLYTYGVSHTSTQAFASALGVVAALMNVLYLLPQLVETVRIQSSGSLSILMLLLQAPGSFLCVVFNFAYGSGWATMLPYFLAGVQQTMLCCLCIFYKYRARYKEWRMKRSIRGARQKDTDDPAASIDSSETEGVSEIISP
eukprot:CAMPEP_0177647322 /NCGR_PEP_ID=MMETSP0447-20121125/10237_1 /TAXON_ID=0 /ORGANISM="Stygamoeba regulata, Strain BSH-02190019" /LENGTH=347 /DNA_ID=CAMNT_0019149897 /DNA_START=343 /DNA_END=1382 /DNA_ORIENTATION=+